MNPLLLEILPLVRQGYCCSQLLMLLLLQSLGRENPEIIRAMHGLCHGMGASEGACGLLTGGACVLGCLAGRGQDVENAHASFVPLVHDYQQWFVGRTERYGGSACFQIMQGLNEEQVRSGQSPDASPTIAEDCAPRTPQVRSGQSPDAPSTIAEDCAPRTPQVRSGQSPDASLCGDLFAECWEKLCTLLEEYAVPMEPR